MATQYRVEYDIVENQYWLVEAVVPRWATLVSRFADWLDDASGHLLCGDILPEWLSFPQLGRLFDRLFFCDDLRAREVSRTVISADLARRLGQAWADEAE